MPNLKLDVGRFLARVKLAARNLLERLPPRREVTEQGSLRWLHAVMRAAILVPSVLVLVSAIYTYFDVTADAKARLEHDTRVVQEHALKVIETATTIAGRTDDITSMESSMLDPENELVLHQKLIDMATGLPQIYSVWVSDEQGRTIASNRFYPVVGRETIIAQREYFRRLQRDPKQRVVFSGRLTGPGGKSYFIAARRRQSADGSFVGITGVALLHGYFDDYYRSIAGSNQDLAVSLLREDGTVMAAFPESIGKTRFPADGIIMRELRAGGVARMEIHDGLDGRERFVQVRRIGDYPLYVAVGTLRSVVMDQWTQRMAMVAGFVLPATVVMVLLCWTALRKVGREHAAIAQWRDEMSRRITVEEALTRAQKLDAIGQMTGGVAHDFNNLLQVVSSNVQIIRLKLPDAGIDGQLAAIDRARSNGESLTRQLLAFSRQQALRPETIDLEQRLPSICELIRHSLRADWSLEWRTEAETWPVEVDPSQLDLALFNLAVNARDAMPGGGQITIRACNVTPDERAATRADLRGDFVAIHVTDTGHGVPDEIAERIFEPFFTTKDVGKGTGLGLSQVYGFATQSGGTVTLQATATGGSTFTIYLPRSHRSQTRRKADGGAAEGIYAANERLLVIEDNAEVGDGIAQLLEQVGFRITLVRSASDGLQRLRDGEQFDLVLTDLVMPGNFNGIQLARLILHDYPGLPVILMTGYSSEVRKASAEGFTILMKPFQISALVNAIRQRLGQTI